MNEEDFIEVMPSETKPIDKRMLRMEAQFLPKLPATFLVLGQCGSGKSSFIWSVMTKGYVVGKKSIFDELIVYLGTLDSKSSFEKMPVDNKLILTEFEPQVFDEYQTDLKKNQLERLENGKPMMNTCIIFDDFFGNNLMKRNKKGGAPPVEKLTLTSRHESNATIFYCSQAYKASGFTAPSVRANITTLVVYKMARNEVRKIADEYAEGYEVNEWIEIYDRVMASRPYAFVVWDRRRPMNADRWTIGFSEPFPPSQKSLEYQSG